MGTQALATFGVYGQPSDDELDVLSLANEYRAAYCAILQEQHEETTDLRNRLFPKLWAAMVESEAWYARIYDLEKAIKKHHSEVRDRNAITEELESQLEAARAARNASMAAVKEERKPYLAMFKSFSAAKKAAADDLVPPKKTKGEAKAGKKPTSAWQRVKSLDDRRGLYDKIVWPADVAEYAAVWLRIDLALRELAREYQSRGLHSSIRQEIVEASVPKLKKDGPGIRYRCGRKPEPRPWAKLTIQFGSGGLLVADSLAGKSRQLSLSVADNGIYTVEQQIGTDGHPQQISYPVKFHRELPPEAVIHRWSLVVREENTLVTLKDGSSFVRRSYRRTCIPIVSGVDFTKPVGIGTLAYDLSWTVRKEGVQVCHFTGAHINERLILPHWLVEKRMAVKDAQTYADNQANVLLLRRGEAISKKPGELQGFAAMEAYGNDHVDDNGVANLIVELQRELARAAKQAESARRCIEDIYKMVACRVCKLHDKIVIDPINLAKIKKYDKRDLLKTDVLPARSREIMFAVAPGKLQAMLKGYGLASVTSGDVDGELPVDARETDVFSTYIRGLGVKTGTKPNAPSHRSRSAAATVKG